MRGDELFNPEDLKAVAEVFGLLLRWDEENARRKSRSAEDDRNGDEGAEAKSEDARRDGFRDA